MKLIGIKRLILLAFLIGVNAVIASAYFLWLGPAREEAQNKLNGVTAEISSLQSKIQNTKVELSEYKTNLPEYEKLKAKGFMQQQDRFQITRDLDVVRQNSKLAGFSFRIDDVKQIENADAAAANMKVIDSRINVDSISTLIDINLYEFLDHMQEQFPAHVRVHSFRIDRKEQLNSAALLRLLRKDTVNFINASAEFDWITYVPIPAPADPNNPAVPR